MFQRIKVFPVVAMVLALTQPVAVFADEVVGHSPDNTAGYLYGGYVAFLLGGAAGGPAGAILGGLAGAWVGAQAQEASGLSGTKHHVKTSQGEVQVLRSPTQFFPVGEEVKVSGGRPRALDYNPDEG